MKSTTLGDVQINEGDFVMADTFSVHFSREIWGEDVDEFRPERFVEEFTQQFAGLYSRNQRIDHFPTVFPYDYEPISLNTFITRRILNVSPTTLEPVHAIFGTYCEGAPRGCGNVPLPTSSS